MEELLFVRGGHIGAGGADGGGSVWEVKKVKKTNVRVHTDTHTRSNFPFVRAGRRPPPPSRSRRVELWTKLPSVGLKCSGCVVVQSDAGGLDEVQNVSGAAGAG